MMSVIINDKKYDVDGNKTVLEVCRENNIYIPTLCYLKDVSEIGACRLCMVEIEGYSRFLAACKTMIKDGMVIKTDSDTLKAYRREMLELILSNHNTECMSCPKNGACSLQRLCNEFGVDGTDYKGSRKDIEDKLPKLKDNPYLLYDPSKCIHCQRCVGACGMAAGNGTLKNARTGVFHIVDAPFGSDWKETDCESCGNCAAACPTGALVLKRRQNYREWETKKVLTTCPHCATGCQYYLVVKDNKIVDVEAADGPSNHGLLCVKGRSGSYDFVSSEERIKHPMIKNKETGAFEEVSWEKAIKYTADKFMELKAQYGGDSLAGFACSRSANEDVYMVQKMVRTCFGSNNTDNCARVCHSATVAGLAKTLGSGAMTNPIYDITHDVDCILLVGSNPEEAHPVVGMQIRQAVKHRKTRLIVVDPRDIGLTKYADIHLKLRPGTNVAFANGMMNVIINEGLTDNEFIEKYTEDFEKIKELVKDYTPEKVGEICHVDPDMLVEAARMYAKAPKAPIIYCLGVTEHSTGTEGVMTMSNLALLTGKLGRSVVELIL